MQTRAPLLMTALLAACQAGGGTDADHSVHYLVAQGDFKQALSQARADWEAHPDDERAAADYRHASVAVLLERGRRATFAGEDERALEDFEQALAIEPDAPQARRWHEKTRFKLSYRWYLTARDRHIEDDLPGAAQAYEVALGYDPDNTDALEGLYRVGVQFAYRDGLSSDYYNEGLQALRERSLHVARSRFVYAGKYRVGDDKPRRRLAEVDGELSAQFAARGLELEGLGHYAAAKNEHRVALQLDGTNEIARDGLERMLLEAEVHEVYKAGEMWIRRGEWNKAVEVLEGGMDRTDLQKERFAELLASIEDLRAAAAYQNGLNLEHDFRYPDAVRAYRALLDERGFYVDARARLTRLEQVVAEVEQVYAELDGLEGAALKAALQRIDVLWPEYRDVQDRLETMGD